MEQAGLFRRNAENLAAGGLALVAFLALSALAIYRHDTFRSHALDLGYLDQVIWNTAHGRFFANTIKGTSWPNYLAGHFAPAIALLSPLFWIWDDVRMLLLVQAAVLMVAGLPIYALLREQGPGVALAGLVAFYLSPWLHRANLQDFHTMLLAAPLLSLAVYGLVRRRFALATIALLAAFTVKEDMGLVAALSGLYLLLFERRQAWLWGLFLLAIGLAWLGLTLLVLIPAFSPSGKYLIVGFRYAYLGESPQAAIRALLHDPLIIFRHVFQGDKILATVSLLASMAFLPLLGGELLLIALPMVWYQQLSDHAMLSRLQQWHTATYLPLFFAAAAVGLGRLPRRERTAAVVVLVLISAIAFVWDGSAIRVLQEPGMDPHRRQIARELIARIPPGAVVSAQSDLLPHLSHRPKIYLFPTVEDAEYVLLDGQGNTYPLERKDYQVFWEAAQDPPNFEKIYDGHGFLLLRREMP